MSYMPTIIRALLLIGGFVTAVGVVYLLLTQIRDLQERVTAIENRIMPPRQRHPIGYDEEKSFELPSQKPWRKDQIASYWESLEKGPPPDSN